jgi:uncharacterized damage-inducible protein DinB
VTNERTFEQFSAPEAGARDVGEEYLAYCRRRLLNEYYPKVEMCLAELNDVDVWWRPHETSNSIGNLILHLNGNIRQWIVAGLGGARDERDRAAEFAERTSIPKAELLQRFHAVLTEADAVLAGLDSSVLLSSRRIQNYDVTCLDAISHVVEHVAQHLGQIIYITKLRKGIDLKFYNL